MSLNGLDDAKVKEAHEGAVAEAGGWYVEIDFQSGWLGRGRAAPTVPALVRCFFCKYRPVADF